MGATEGGRSIVGAWILEVSAGAGVLEGLQKPAHDGSGRQLALQSLHFILNAIHFGMLKTLRSPAIEQPVRLGLCPNFQNVIDQIALLINYI